MHQFPCPHCSTPLRVRDLSYRGRVINCPDCGKALEIQGDRGELFGVAHTESEPRTQRLRTPSQRTPRLVAAGVVIALSAGLLLFALSGGKDQEGLPQPASRANVTPPPVDASPAVAEAPNEVAASSDVSSGQIPPSKAIEGSASHLDTEPITVELAEVPPPTVKSPEVKEVLPNPASLIESLAIPEIKTSAEPPAIDFPKALAQRILAFELEQPTPLEKLLPEIEELLGAPIDWTQLSTEVRQQAVTVSVQDGTVADVLDAVVSQAGLTYSIDPRRIVVRSSDEPVKR